MDTNDLEKITAKAVETTANFWERTAPRQHERYAPDAMCALEQQARTMFWAEMAENGVFPPEPIISPREDIVIEDAVVPAGTAAEILVYGWAGTPVQWGLKGFSTKHFHTVYHKRPYGWGEMVPDTVWVRPSDSGSWVLAY